MTSCAHPALNTPEDPKEVTFSISGKVMKEIQGLEQASVLPGVPCHCSVPS